MGIPSDAQVLEISAPLGGWNTRDNVDDMKPMYATELINYFPRNDLLELKRGSVQFATGMTTDVRHLVSHNETAGSRLLACANNNIYNCTSGTPSSLVSGLTNNDWSSVSIDGATVLCNGADAVKYYTISGGLQNASLVGPTAANLEQVTNYKGRLYFVDKTKPSYWYGPDGAFSAGTFTEVQIGKLLNKGGRIRWIAGWTRDTGSTAEELLVIMSTEGEALIYTGAFPGSADFRLVTKIFTGKPMHKNAFFRMGADLLAITADQIYPMSSYLTLGEVNKYSNIDSSLISNIIQSSTRLYAQNVGWNGIVFEDAQMGIINIPISSTQSEQYVWNTSTRAWTKFTGWNARCWAVHNKSLYFGTEDGRIIQAYTGSSDLGSSIMGKVCFAYNYFKDRIRYKDFLEICPKVKTTGRVIINAGVDNDYKNSPYMVSTDVNVDGTEWNTELWNTSQWSSGVSVQAPCLGIKGYGKNAQIRIETISNSVQAAILSCGLRWKRAGI